MADDTFYPAISDPDLARKIMEDPIAAHLNLAIHGLPSSLARYCTEHGTYTKVVPLDRPDLPRPTFSLALHSTLAKTIYFQNEKDIIAIIRACMQVLVTYSLIHEQFGWIGGEAHRTIENLTGRISILLHFGTKVLPTGIPEASMKRNAVDAVMSFKNKGMVFTHFSTVVGKLVELDKMLKLDREGYVMFRPEEKGAMRKMGVLARMLKRGKDDMAGGACALLVHYPARYAGGL
ncbi:MAG: hypothetical protein Q9168_004156 [Polycauliona sp. 1 TL-2023]